MASLPQALVETMTISIGRTSLFYACRHYLLRSLYYDLRHLSSPYMSDDSAPTPAGDVQRRSETELSDLPQPATTPRTPSEFGSSQDQGTSNGTPWHSGLARMIFSLCFSESCTLFLLVLCQAAGVFSPSGRYVNWRISLGLLISAILLAAPLLQCILLTHRTESKGSIRFRRSITSHIFLTGAPYCIYLVALSHIPLPSRLEAQDFSTTILSRLVVLGTLILGVLTGFGATSAVYNHLQLSIARRDPVSDSEIVAAEQALFRVRSDLLERQRQLETNNTSETISDSGFLSRLNPFSSNSEISALQREIKGLEALEYQMARDLDYLQRRHAVAQYSNTFRGRVWRWMGKIFAIYCAFRVISSIINLMSPFTSKTAGPSSASSSPDIIAYLLAQFVSIFLPVSEADIAVASRQLSLLLVGAIILSSVRRALQGVTRVLKITSRNLAASLLMLLLAQLMGTYMLSTLIQLRTSFPTSSDTEEHSNLFATLPEYHVFGPLWDGSFLASVVISGVVRWLDERVNGPGLG